MCKSVMFRAFFFFEIEDENGCCLRMLEKMIGCPISCLHNDSYLVYIAIMGNRLT